MPITGGEYQPEDEVDVANIEATFQDQNLPVPENLPINTAQIEESPSMGEVAGMAKREWYTSKFDRGIMDFLTEWPDPNFKQPWDTLEPEYYQYRPLFERAYSAEAWSKARGYANQEIEDNAMKRNMTAEDYVTYLGVHMADPIVWALSIPTFGLGVMGKGFTLGQATLRTAALVGAESTALEAGMQLADPLRTWDESLFTIAASTGIGALTGLGGQKLYNVFHNAKGQRNAADNLPKVIEDNYRKETNLVRVENALDMGVPLDNVTIPPRPLPPARMAVEGEPIFPEEISYGGLGGKFTPESLGESGSEMYREVGMSRLRELVQANRGGSDVRVFVSDNPDLALGQQENKGIKVTFHGDHISGQENKIPASPIMEGKEYKTNYIAKSAIKQIVVPEQYATAIDDAMFLRKSLERSFDQSTLEDGTRIYTPKASKEPTPPPARMAIEDDAIPGEDVLELPPPESYVNEMPTDFDEVNGVIDDFLDTRDPGTFISTIKEETPLFTPFKPIVWNKVMMSPVTILMYNGYSPTFSRFGDMLGSNNIYKHGNYNQTRYNGLTLREEIKRSERRAFVTMSDGAAETQALLAKKNVKQSLDQIASDAGRAARRNSDQDEFLPEVYALGQKFRQQLDDWKERGIEQGVFTEQNLVETENYVPRFWDMDTVSREPALFRSVIEAWALAKPEFADLDIDLDKLVFDIKDTLNRVNSGESHPMVFNVHRKKPTSGHAKPRRIDAKDLDLEHFLVSDIRVLADRYARGVGADIIVREIFGKDNIMDYNGLPMPKAQFEQGVAEFNAILKELEPKVDAGSKLAKMKHRRIEKRREATIKAAENMLRAAMQRPEISRFPKLDSFGRGIQGYAAGAGLGGVILAAQPDAGNNVLQHGMVNMLGALPEFFKSLPQVFSRHQAGGNRAEYWREQIVAVDNLMSNRMMDVAGLEDASTMGVKQGSWHGTEVARKAFRFFLADRYNTLVKLLAGTSAERAIFRDVVKMGKGKELNKNRAAKMHQIGATQDVAERIAANLKEHGKTKGLINWKEWDEETFQDLSRMLFRESEFQVVAPDKGEEAAWMNTMPGRLWMQFKTFMVSNTLKQSIPWSQKLFAKGDVTVLAGLAFMGGLAIWSRFIRDVAKSFDKDVGFDIDEVLDEWGKKTPADLAAIAVKDGALLSFYDLLIGQADNFFNNELGEAVGMTPQKRYWSPGLGIESNMAGLTYAGNVVQGGWVAGQSILGQKDYTARDLNKVKRSIPGQSTFYLQWLFDWGEQELVDEFNLPESNQKKAGGMF